MDIDSLKPQIEPASEGQRPSNLAGIEIFTVPEANALFEIIGDDSQLVEIDVSPGSQVMAEPGTMCHMTPGFTRSIESGGCCKGFKRCCCAGEACFRIRFVNETNSSLQLGLTPNFPAKIIPVDLDKFSGVTVKSGAFMGALSPDVDVQLRWVGNCCAGCCGGSGFILNSLHGTGVAFLNASGTCLTKTLQDGEVLIVDTDSVVAFEKTVGYDVRRNRGCLMCCCGGEGLYNTVLTGPGLVILQSMSFEKMATKLRQAAPQQ